MSFPLISFNLSVKCSVNRKNVGSTRVYDKYGTVGVGTTIKHNIS